MLSGLFLHIAALLTVSEALIDQSVEDVQELLVDWKLVKPDGYFARPFQKKKILHDIMECARRTMSLRKRLQDKNTTEMF